MNELINGVEVAVSAQTGDGAASVSEIEQAAGIAEFQRDFFPFRIRASGLYKYSTLRYVPIPIPRRLASAEAQQIEEAELEEDQAVNEFLPGIPFPWRPPRLPVFPLWREDLRLDVDGRYPLNVASGTVSVSFTSRMHWVANLTRRSRNTWTGEIWYKDGNTGLVPQTRVTIEVTRSFYPNQRTAKITYSGGGYSPRTVTCRFASMNYRNVEFEFDSATGENPVTSYNTGSHSNRPSSLPTENLTIQNVFRRAGFGVTTSRNGGIVPIQEAGVDQRWSDQEMHDAMQTYWSRFADRPQWAMWVFFASLHEQGTSLGGIMFDDIGPNHRQGTAIFNDSFISNSPPGDPEGAGWVNRMVFWTACHEMGHGFNLAHSWQKELGTSWIPIANEREERSFMNYPFNVAGGEASFFSDFEFKFSDAELLFMRHAPERFVRMGDADWFDNHAFEQAGFVAEPRLKLELRVNRNQAVYEFLEPIYVELKLTNSSPQPVTVDRNLLATSDALKVILKQDGRPARQLLQYVQQCWEVEPRVLAPGESVYEPIFISAGRNGWDIAEPGNYTVHVAVQTGESQVVSNPLRLRIMMPGGQQEELLAQNFLSDGVGRVLALNGSRFLTPKNPVLEEVIEQLPESAAAIHTQLALEATAVRVFKQLEIDEAGEIAISRQEPDTRQAIDRLGTALAQGEKAAQTLGHITFRRRIEESARLMSRQGAKDEALANVESLAKTLESRVVNNRKIPGSIIEEVRSFGANLAEDSGSSENGRTNGKR